MNEHTFYAVLEVDAAADLATIQAAFERLSTQYDPAQFRSAAPDLRAYAAERYAAINRAWATLSDPDARERYDQQLAQAAQPDEIDYRPLIAGARTSSPQALAWIKAPIVLGFGLVATVVGTLLLVWLGTQPPAPQTNSDQMPLFASMIAAEIPDSQVRDQLLTLDAVASQAESLIRQDPRNHIPWVLLGNAHYDFIQTIYEYAPDGQAYALNLERWEQASDAYSSALKLEPFQPIVRSDLALAQIRYGLGIQNYGYVELGLAEAEQALQQDDQTPQVLLNVGRAFVLADEARLPEAQQLWQQVIAHAPQTLLAQQAESLLQGARP